MDEETSLNQELIDELSAARTMPALAIARAIVAPDQIADETLRVLDLAASGTPLNEKEENLLFWGLHVLGAARDQRGFPSFMRLLRRPEDELNLLLGDATTETLPRIVAGMFDGNTAALHAVLADRTADMFVRQALFGTLAFLTAAGRIDRADTRAFLQRFDDERLSETDDFAWDGWESAIALLGLREFAERVEAARADDRILIEEDGPVWFAETVERAAANLSDLTLFAENGLGYIEDVVAELSWTDRDFSDLELAEPDTPDPDNTYVGEPVRNPFRHVGRNDPCPCGSGKKFKKCCLGKE